MIMFKRKGPSARMMEALQAAMPAMVAAVETFQPILRAGIDELGEASRKAAEALRALRPQRVPPARKPCTWCGDLRKRPATHTVKWREPVVWWDEFDNTPTYWPAGRTMRMCEFHAEIAERYKGVRAYRFRRLT